MLERGKLIKIGWMEYLEVILLFEGGIITLKKNVPNVYERRLYLLS